MRVEIFVLIGCAVMFFFGMLIELINPGSMAFEVCKIIFPSLGSISLGYYFGNNK